MREDMVTPGAGIALGRSSVRTGSIQQIVTPAPEGRSGRKPLQPARPEDGEEDYRRHDQGERKPDEADHRHAEVRHLRPAEIKGAEHRRTDEQGSGYDGEDEPVGQNIPLADQLVEATVPELYLELTVGELREEQPDLLRVILGVTGVLQREFPGSLQHGFRVVALDEEPAGVGTGHLVDVYGRVYGAGDPFGDHESLGQEREDRRHPEPVAPRQRDELRERLPQRDLPHREPGVLVQKHPEVPHQVVAHLGSVPYAQRLKSPQGGSGVALYDGDEEPAERLDVAPAHVADHTEVQQGEVSFGRKEKVARMRVTVEEAVLEGHLEDRVRPHRGYPPTLGRGEQEGPDVAETGALDVLQREHLRGGEIQVDPGDHHPRPGEVGREAPSVLGLGGVVQLAPDDALELRHEAAHVHEDPVPEPAVQEACELPHELEVRLYPARRLGPLHLDRDDLPVPQHRPVNLPDARRAQRGWIEALENLPHGCPELPLDYQLRRPRRHRLRRVLELLELEEHALGQDVRARGQKLAELDEGRSEIVEGPAEPDAEVRREKFLEPLLLPPVPPDVEDEAEPVAHQNAPYLGETPQVPRRRSQRLTSSVHHGQSLSVPLEARRGVRLVAGRLGSHVGAGRRGLRSGHALGAAGPRGRRDGRGRLDGPVLEHPYPVLELFDAEDQVLVVLPRREAGPPEALLRRGIHQRAGPRRAFPRPSQDLIHEGLALLALEAALLDQAVHDLLHLVARGGGGSYLQKDQPLERLADGLAHNYLPITKCTAYMITKAQPYVAMRRRTGARA